MLKISLLSILASGVALTQTERFCLDIDWMYLAVKHLLYKLRDNFSVSMCVVFETDVEG